MLFWLVVCGLAGLWLMRHWAVLLRVFLLNVHTLDKPFAFCLLI
jgi:hypothetical protein